MTGDLEAHLKRLRLVQRLWLLHEGQRVHSEHLLFGAFRLDCMGTVESERGAVPATLETMTARALPNPVALHNADRTGWYIGRPEFQALAQTFFNVELADPGPSAEVGYERPYQLTEPSGLAHAYRVGSVGAADRGTSADGWWALDEGQSWALFHTQEAAKLWWDGLASVWKRSFQSWVAEKLGATVRGSGRRGLF